MTRSPEPCEIGWFNAQAGGACDHSQAWFNRHAEAIDERCLKNESFAALRPDIDIGHFEPTDGGWAAEKCRSFRVSSCAAVIPWSGIVAEKLEFLMQPPKSTPRAREAEE
jgi:hypothetical protein